MKFMLVVLLVLAVTLAVSAKHLDTDDFNLTAHITAVNVQQGYESHGRTSTDENGNVTGSSHGKTYDYRIFTVKIDGNPITYQMRCTSFNCESQLHINNYNARWKKEGILEVILTNDKGKEKTINLRVVGEQAQ
jgi:hypothetical protein